MIPRILAKTIDKSSKAGFVNIIYGPRRVGKTVLLQQLTKKVPKEDTVWFNGDTEETRNTLSSTSEVGLAGAVGKAKWIVVDEAQRIPNIGLSLKILVDKYPERHFLVTGSSSLMLSRGIQEPLTGRNVKYRLFPFSTSETVQKVEDYKKVSYLNEQLLFGGYPYVWSLSLPAEKQEYLKNVVSDYLFKDVLSLKDIETPEILKKLATLLAFQIGNEVSFNELSRNLVIDVKTVKKYISLLKQSFVIFEVGSYSRNLRKEIAKGKKYYFWDLGIRNALTEQFQPLEIRPDAGAIWENFLAVERKKRFEYERLDRKTYFWRTYEGAEIDWIEVEGQEVVGVYEFKLKEEKVRTPKAFEDTYQKKVYLVNKDNYLDFVI